MECSRSFPNHSTKRNAIRACFAVLRINCGASKRHAAREADQKTQNEMAVNPFLMVLPVIRLYLARSAAI